MEDQVKKANGLSGVNRFCLIVAAILIAIGMVVSAANLFYREPLVAAIITLIVYLALLFYGVYGYKIPHGNLLKYIMLAFAVYNIVICAFEGMIVFSILNGLAVVGVCEMGGRLNRYKQVMIIGCIVFALLLTSNILQKANEATHFLNSGQQNPIMNVQPDDENGGGPGQVEAFDGSKTENSGVFTGAENDGQMPAGPEAGPQKAENSMIRNISIHIETFSLTILWGALLLIYSARYKLHKEAGLKDKNE